MAHGERVGSGTDLRVRRTRKMIGEAFVSLVLERGFEKVTVEEISARAMVNRATFYRHYRDKWDLAERTADAMLDDLASRLDPPPKDVGEVSLEEPPRAWVDLFEHLRDNADLYRAVLGEKGFPMFSVRVRGYLERLLRRRYEAAGYDGRNLHAPEGVLLAFVIGAFLGTVGWWLENDAPHPPEEMALWLARLLVLGPYHELGMVRRGPGA